MENHTSGNKLKVNLKVLLLVLIVFISIGYNYYAIKNLKFELLGSSVESTWKTEEGEQWIKMSMIIKIYNPSIVPIKVLGGNMDTFVKGEYPHNFYIGSGKFDSLIIPPGNHIILRVPISFIYLSPYRGREIPISLMYIAVRGKPITMIITGLISINAVGFKTNVPFNASSKIYII